MSQSPTKRFRPIGLTAGNLGSQKYEASCHIERFLNILHHTEPTKETSAWRKGERKLYKRHDGRKVLQAKYRVQENLELRDQLYRIHTEDRKNKTIEYAPGWRVGNINGGLCIDCYQTQNKIAMNYKQLHNYERIKQRREKQMQQDDAILQRNLSQLKSPLSAGVMKKEYEKNRYRARFFFNKQNNTILHLGLLRSLKQKMGKQQQQKRQRPSSAAASLRDEVASNSNRPPWDATHFQLPPISLASQRPIYLDQLSLQQLVASTNYSPLELPKKFPPLPQILSGGGNLNPFRSKHRPLSAPAIVSKTVRETRAYDLDQKREELISEIRTQKAEAAAKVQVKQLQYQQKLEEEEVDAGNNTTRYRKRNVCLLETNVLPTTGYSSLSSSTHPLPISIFDVGISLPSLESLSSGIVVKSPNGGGELFLPMRTLRTLASHAGASALSHELAQIKSRDKQSGLYEPLCDNLSPDAEAMLCDLVLKNLCIRFVGDDTLHSGCDISLLDQNR